MQTIGISSRGQVVSSSGVASGRLVDSRRQGRGFEGGCDIPKWVSILMLCQVVQPSHTKKHLYESGYRTCVFI